MGDPLETFCPVLHYLLCSGLFRRSRRSFAQPSSDALLILMNKTETSKVGAISEAQKAQFLKCVGRFCEKLLFLNLRLLLKTQNSLNITSKVRI